VSALRRKIRTREVVRDEPNFRDYGMTVERDLLRILGNLQKEYGEAWASEAGLRSMILQDRAHCPGVSTLPKALVRLQEQGLVEKVRLKPGGILPSGEVCTHGTCLIYIPQGRRARRALVTRVKHDARAGETRRIHPRMAHTLEQARAQIGKAVTPLVDARSVDAERKRRDDLARLADLAAQWDAEGKAPKKPPD
jgi:hypothetical protein